MKRGEGISGWGAWQVGLRFSYLDLNDKAIQGGMVYDWTAGLNWFWNPNMKIQLNYILDSAINLAWPRPGSMASAFAERTTSDRQ